MDTKEILKILGLSDKEVDVYWYLLGVKSARAHKIAKETDLNRSTVYVILESLQNRDLVIIKKGDGSVATFSVLPPDKLLEQTEHLIKRYSSLVGQLHTILPELKARYRGDGPKSRIRLYDGAEGLIEAYEETLTSTEEIRAYASIENMHHALPGYFPSYYKRRADKGISIKSIHPDTPESQERVSHNDKEKRTSALVPKNKYNFSPEINIFDNKIVFMSLIEKFALVIESRELADALKKVFELSWLQAKKFDKQRKISL